MSHLKLAFLLFGCMLSGVYLLLAGTEVARHAYIRYNAGSYHKTTLQVERFNYPLKSVGRKRPGNLMAYGIVEGEEVEVSLKSLRSRLIGLPRAEQLATLERGYKTIPIYKRDQQAADILIMGRSPGFLEADYFEHGQSRAKPVFIANLILFPTFFLMVRRRLKRNNQSFQEGSGPSTSGYSA